jgi:hypothetical protein
MKTRYIGIYNYTKNDLPLTKMIEFDHDKAVVEHAIKEHCQNTENSLDNYHISEYECNDWSNTDSHDLPIKVSEQTRINS